MGHPVKYNREQKIAPAWVKEQGKFDKRKYPYCKGTFPDCPETIQEGIVAEICQKCPIYKK